MIAALLGFVAAWIAAAAVERWGGPPRAPGRGSGQVAAFRTGALVVVYLALLAVFWRPGLTSLATVAWVIVAVYAGNVKRKLLHEPLVVTDLALVAQVVRFPAMYIAYAGYGRVAAILAAEAVTVAALLVLEPPLAPRDSVTGWLGPLALLVVAGVGAAVLVAVARRLPAGEQTGCPDPHADVAAHGPVGALIVQGLCFARTPAPACADLPTVLRPLPLPLPQPHVLLVQNESFFDARRAFPRPEDIRLPAWDTARSRALATGRFGVTTFGANTMRAEFSVLTGVAPETLGVDAFNPYLRLVDAGTPSLIRILKQQGYRTVCIHPYDFRFFDRDRVFPKLGFESLIDAHAFAAGDRVGRYVGDLAVARHVLDMLAAAPGPVFVFAITMENHGPYDPTAPVSDYLRHLANTDAMVDALTIGLTALPRPGVLGFYGDHRPPLPEARGGGAGDVSTDYAVWSTVADGGGASRDLAPHELPALVLETAAAVQAGPVSARV